MAILESLALGSSLFGRSGNKSSAQTADQIYAAHTREDLARYNDELAPLETMYANHLIGPQAEANRASFMQTVNQQSDMAFDRAQSRTSERNRKFGLSADRNESRKLQRGRQLSKATNSTNAGRFYDQLRTDLL